MPLESQGHRDGPKCSFPMSMAQEGLSSPLTRPHLPGAALHSSKPSCSQRTSQVTAPLQILWIHPGVRNTSEWKQGFRLYRCLPNCRMQISLCQTLLQRRPHPFNAVKFPAGGAMRIRIFFQPDRTKVFQISSSRWVWLPLES